MVRVKFLGACREVTGSMHLVETENVKILLDCGMRQGKNVPRVYEFPFDPEEIDYVILSHAHIDHSGLLPLLYLKGFRGKIISTTATRDVTELLLLDSAKIMKEEQEKYNIPPLFDEYDVRETMLFFETYEYHRPIKLEDGVKVEFLDAGHIVGSAVTLLRINETILCYTGDIGHGNSPLMNPPETPKAVDVLIMESTYGNREHESREEGIRKLAEICNEVLKDGKLLIPVFAVGRAQEIIFELKRLMQAGKIPRVKVYLDTPLGCNVTEIYRNYAYMLRREFYELFLKGKDPLSFEQLEYVKSAGRSIEIARSDEKCIILSASGMLEGGRVLNHLPKILPDENSAILFVGFQAEGTLGREILDGAKKIAFGDTEIDVRCRVYSISCFSAHADKYGLRNFVEQMDYYPTQIFIVHGEKEQAEGLYKILPKVRKCIPNQFDEVVLSPSKGTDLILDENIGFVKAFGLEFTQEPLAIVREGGGRLRVVRFGDLIGMLEESKRVCEERMKTLVTEKVESIDVDDNALERLREFRERKILSNKLAREIVNLLLKGNKNEVIRLLRLKKEKRRFPVSDENLVEEFVSFMTSLITQKSEEEIIGLFKELVHL